MSSILCQTKNKKRGRPQKKGRSVRVTVRLHEQDHVEILARLARLERGSVSAYIRRVLAGASVELLESALVESDELSDALDGMLDWEDDCDDTNTRGPSPSPGL